MLRVSTIQLRVAQRSLTVTRIMLCFMLTRLEFEGFYLGSGSSCCPLLPEARSAQQPKTYPHPPIPAARLLLVILCFSAFSSTRGNPEVGGGDSQSYISKGI